MFKIVKLVSSFLLSLTLLGADPSWQFQTIGARPLRELAFELQHRFGWLVTYEEGIYEGSSLKADLATPDRLLQPIVPPHLFTLEQAFDQSKAKRFTASEQAMVLRALTKEYNQHFRLGSYVATSEGPFVHLRPALWSNSGKAETYSSVLDTPVVLSNAQSYSSLQAMLVDLLSQVERFKNTNITLGQFPANTFSSQQPRFDVKSGTPARLALAQIIQQADLDFISVNLSKLWSYSWELIYDGNSKTYFFNIVRVTNPAVFADSVPRNSQANADVIKETDNGAAKFIKRK